MAEFSTAVRLQNLCRVSTRACAVLSPMVVAFYSAITGETAKLKSDASVFTIADGIVQHLLVEHLFCGDKFAAIVGEEDSTVDINQSPYKVEDLTVPEDFTAIVDAAKEGIKALSQEIDQQAYKDLTIFIDPIDGTREFSTGLGEQCSICIGFSDASGKPVAGVVYRPITQPPTYVAGAASEGFVERKLDMATTENANPKGLLTSNGSISPFIQELMRQLGYSRVPSGGAGNKMLMLLEGKGSAYIQDRGVSRWDTCGAEACIEAHGGLLKKLTKFAAAGDAGAAVSASGMESYTYLQSESNLDFEEGTSNLTPYNCIEKGLVKKGEPSRLGSLAEFKPYSNICGLLALSAAGNTEAALRDYYAAIQATKQISAPSFD